MADMNFFTQGVWCMTETYASCQEIFGKGRWLKFSMIDATRAQLAVYDSGDLARETLPSYIQFQLVNGELVGADYGRSVMRFRAHPTKDKWLQYEGDYVNHQHQPDEGGDGDPK